MAGTCKVLGGSDTAPIVAGVGGFVVGALVRGLTTGLVVGSAAALIVYLACK